MHIIKIILDNLFLSCLFVIFYIILNIDLYVVIFLITIIYSRTKLYDNVIDELEDRIEKLEDIKNISFKKEQNI